MLASGGFGAVGLLVGTAVESHCNMPLYYSTTSMPLNSSASGIEILWIWSCLEGTGLHRHDGPGTREKGATAVLERCRCPKSTSVFATPLIIDFGPRTADHK